MFKDRKTDEYMYPILDYENYSVSHKGIVGRSRRVRGNADRYQDYDYLTPYNNHGSPYVRISNEHGEKKVSVARLVVSSAYGMLPFKIKYRDEDTSHVSIDNLYYKYDEYQLLDEVIIDDVLYEGPIMKLYDRDDPEHRFGLFRALPEEYIPTNRRYWISPNGAIYDIHRSMLNRRSNNDYGYYKTTLRIPTRRVDGKLVEGYNVFPRVHLLVYATWKDWDLKGYNVDHIDGRRHNCSISNLEKVSFEENIRRRNERNVDDDLIITSRWKESEVHKICKLLESGKTYSEVAKEFGVDPSDKNSKEYRAIQNICKSIMDRRVFKYISKEYNVPTSSLSNRHVSEYKTPQKFDPETIRKICEEFVNGKGPAEVSRLYPEVPLGTIQGIKQGRQYKEIASSVPGMDEVIANRKKVNMESFKRENKVRWTDDDIHKICAAISEGKSNQDISEMLGFGREPSPSNKVMVSNIIGALYSRRQHTKIASQYTFPESRKGLEFPNAGRFKPGNVRIADAS